MSMSFESVLTSRRSIRDFKDTPVPERLIHEVLNDALHAPSSSNTQSYKVIVAQGDTLRQIGAELSKKHQIASTLGQHNLLKRAYLAIKHNLIPNRVFRTVTGKYPEPFYARSVTTGVGLYQLLGIKRDDMEGRQRQMARNYEFFGAPVAIWIFAAPKMKYVALLDSGIFLQNLMLSATNKGLSTCAQGTLNIWRSPLDAHFDIPKQYDLVCGVSLGYASDHVVNSYQPEKIGLDELLIPAKPK